MPSVIAPHRRPSERNNAAARNPTTELTWLRFRHADAARKMNTIASRSSAIMTIRRMPVIPYTLNDTCLWREFRVRTTLSAHRTPKAHEALQVDHDSGRCGGDCPLLLYVDRPG